MSREYDGPSGLTIIVACMVAFLVIAAAIFGIRWAMAGPSGKLQAREQILSGQNRIRAYDHFFSVCGSVQNAEAALDASYEELAQTAKDDFADLGRIRTNITANKIARQSAVNEYNLDARKSYTDGQFRDLDLPYQLPVLYEKGNRTSCES